MKQVFHSTQPWGLHSKVEHPLREMERNNVNKEKENKQMVYTKLNRKPLTIIAYIRYEKTPATLTHYSQTVTHTYTVRL